jgi:GTP cyclohydrolase I
MPTEQEALAAVRTLIEWAGDDPDRVGLRETPRRVLAFYREWSLTTHEDFALTRFSTTRDDLVIVRDIPVFSLCGHHMLPFFGRVSVGYVPIGEVLGLSKIARIVRRCASRLTIQEELTGDIAAEVSNALMCNRSGGVVLFPPVGVVMTAVHTCMVIRGPRAFGSETVTSAMLGDMREDASLRAEFLGLVEYGRGVR